MPRILTGVWNIWLHTLLHLALNGGEKSASCFNCFIPPDKESITYLTGEWWAPELVWMSPIS